MIQLDKLQKALGHLDKAILLFREAGFAACSVEDLHFRLSEAIDSYIRDLRILDEKEKQNDKEI